MMQIPLKILVILTIYYVYDYMTNKSLTPLFTRTWFSDAFIALFGYPCCILTQCGIYFSTFLFEQATLTLIVKLYRTISIKYILNNNITIFSSIAHGFFNVLTARIVNDLNESQNKKPKSTLLKSKSLDNVIDTSTHLINHSTDGTSPPPFYTKRPNKIQFPKFNLFPKRHHNSHQKTAPLPFSPVQHPPLPNYTHKNFHPNDNLTSQHDTLINNSVTPTADTPIKIYSPINYSFSPPSSLTLSQFFCKLSSSTLVYSFISSQLLLLHLLKPMQKFIFLNPITHLTS